MAHLSTNDDYEFGSAAFLRCFFCLEAAEMTVFFVLRELNNILFVL